MPENLAQWLWFIFYTVGSFGGIFFIILAAPVVFDEGRKRLARRK